ncbi:hypothetical protein BS50DRAFT_584447 [Corynespora cassiicola Philippines]|uniref:Uncharacterized protein n=1 Tax=Corynespora cassiicola Philippines TaxID=1448308 RepID=A0A2T2NZM6_CORCC|nr:hypothetical protein BS50DRAFT_584447 [Corynespora cassiicola Philippines]
MPRRKSTRAKRKPSSSPSRSSDSPNLIPNSRKRRSARLAEKPVTILREEHGSAEWVSIYAEDDHNFGTEKPSHIPEDHNDSLYTPSPTNLTQISPFTTTGSQISVAELSVSNSVTRSWRSTNENPSKRSKNATSSKNTKDVKKPNGSKRYKIPDLISSELLKAAEPYVKPGNRPSPDYLKPPILEKERLKVDELSVWLYAEDGASNIWASALSSTRFGGPRKYPPFRELHRLTSPPDTDGSDWAENIRWAKEQYKLFGSDTWTEYDYHLEQITEHRREVKWVSEQAIQYA